MTTKTVLEVLRERGIRLATDRVAARAGMSVSAVRRALASLETGGLVERSSGLRRVGNGRMAEIALWRAVARRGAI